MKTIKVSAEVREDGLYLHLSSDGTDGDTIGPIDLNDPRSHTAILQEIETAGPGSHPPSRRLRKRADRTELKVAEDIGGRKQKASGALPHAKGDVRLRGKHRVEIKTCTLKGYHIKREDLDKIRGEAAFGEKPAFVVEFVDKFTLKREDRWVLIPYEDWHEAHVDRGSPGSGS